MKIKTNDIIATQQLKNNKIKPLFKYIGGKSWLRDELRSAINQNLNHKITTYIEPFAGGLGAFLSVYDILLENSIRNVTLSDINETLIFTYNSIKVEPLNLINEFLLLENEFNKKINPLWKETKDKSECKKYLKEAELFFKKIKKEFNSNKNNINIKQSARLIFLQKHAFNGIYRENLKGEYNTPFNWSGSNMLETIEIKVNEISKLFNQFNLEFKCQSFDEIEYNNHTLYYLDPPYLNEEINENKYNKNSFGIKEQLLLLDKIKNKNFIYSNHKAKLLLDEFNKFKDVQIKEIARKNIMSAKSSTRQDDKIEILVSSK